MRMFVWENRACVDLAILERMKEIKHFRNGGREVILSECFLGGLKNTVSSIPKVHELQGFSFDSPPTDHSVPNRLLAKQNSFYL